MIISIFFHCQIKLIWLNDSWTIYWYNYCYAVVGSNRWLNYKFILYLLQARLQHRNNPFRRGGAIRPFLGQRRQGGENFIDRLIRDNNRQNVEGDAALPANILPQRNPHQQGQDHLTGNEFTCFFFKHLAVIFDECSQNEKYVYFKNYF